MKRSPQLFMIGKKTTFYGDTAVQCVILVCSEVNYTRAAMSVLKEENSLKTKFIVQLGYEHKNLLPETGSKMDNRKGSLKLTFSMAKSFNKITV